MKKKSSNKLENKKRSSKSKKLGIIIGAILLVLIIAGVVIGVVLKNSKIPELTKEDYGVICNYFQTEAEKCINELKVRTDITSISEMGELLQVCMEKIYKKIERDYGINQDEMLLVLTRQCVDIAKESYNWTY